jgi:uncharacterized protein (TIGR00290 family)
MEKAVLFWSGGKDSALALYKVQQEANYEVMALVTTINEKFRRISMHGVRESLLDQQAAATGIPLIKMWVKDHPSNEVYEAALMETFDLLKNMGIGTVIYGDIFLEDLRKYREDLLNRKGLKAYFPLWFSDTRLLADEFSKLGFKTVSCCINTASLDKSFLGKEINKDFLNRLPAGTDPCGENGEFHSFCFSGPVFSEDIRFVAGEEKFTPLPVETIDGTEVVGYWFLDLK